MYVYYNPHVRSSVSPRTGAALLAFLVKPRWGIGDEATAITGTVLSSLAPIPVAGPFLAAAGQLVAMFGNIFSGCGATCTQATQYANQAGADLQNLMAQYFSIPAPRPQSAQTAYLNAVTQIIAWLQQMCGNPALGQAGQRCILERLQRRPCPSTLNDSNIGGAQINFCDYYSTFYDPVANDPDVVPDSSLAPIGTSTASASPAISSLTSGSIFGIPLTALLLPAGLLLAAFLIGGED
jgi:hypothetical protein